VSLTKASGQQKSQVSSGSYGTISDLVLQVIKHHFSNISIKNSQDSRGKENFLASLGFKGYHDMVLSALNLGKSKKKQNKMISP
jgi:hypothetical protein